jgi:hypothetical protein
MFDEALGWPAIGKSKDCQTRNVDENEKEEGTELSQECSFP